MSLLDVNPTKLKIVNKPVVERLPRDIYVEYHGVLFGKYAGRQFIIAVPRDEFDYKSFRLFVQAIGSAGFERAEIQKVIRYRDGGTTEIESDIGKFRFPSCFKPDEPSTLNDQQILRFDRY